MEPEDRLRRLSLQERGQHAQAHPGNLDHTAGINRHVSFPNGPGTVKMRRYSVCAVSRHNPHHSPSPPSPLTVNKQVNKR